MKMPIEWHQNCLRNSLRSLDEARQQLARKEAAVARHEKDLEHYKTQIETALTQGKDGFDSEKFLSVKKQA